MKESSLGWERVGFLPEKRQTAMPHATWKVLLLSSSRRVFLLDTCIIVQYRQKITVERKQDCARIRPRTNLYQEICCALETKCNFSFEFDPLVTGIIHLLRESYHVRSAYEGEHRAAHGQQHQTAVQVEHRGRCSTDAHSDLRETHTRDHGQTNRAYVIKGSWEPEATQRFTANHLCLSQSGGLSPLIIRLWISWDHAGINQ